MLNVLKMDFYRLFRGKLFYGILLVLVSLCFLSAIISRSVFNQLSSNTQEEIGQKNSIVLVDDSNIKEADQNYSTKIEFITDVFSGNIVVMTLIIFSALFAGAYKRTRYEKNIISAVKKRWYFIVSNAIICFLVSMIAVILLLVTSTISHALFMPGYSELPFGSITKLCLFLVSYFVLLVCMTYLTSSLIRQVRNHIGGIVVALLYGSGLVYGIINLALSPLLGSSFRIEAFLPLGTMYSLSIDSISSFIACKSLVLALAFGALSLLIDVIVSNKKDIAC